MSYKHQTSGVTDNDTEFVVEFCVDSSTERSGGFSVTLVEYTDVSITLNERGTTLLYEHLKASNQKMIDSILEYWLEHEAADEEQDAKDCWQHDRYE